MEAIAESPSVQMPPDRLSVNVAVEPTHIEPLPEIDASAGTEETVTVWVA